MVLLDPGPPAQRRRRRRPTRDGGGDGECLTPDARLSAREDLLATRAAPRCRRLARAGPTSELPRSLRARLSRLNAQARAERSAAGGGGPATKGVVASV